MHKIFLYTLLFALCGLFFVSCNDGDEFDPFTQQTKGEFTPNEVTLKKSSNSMDIIETWANIVRNSQNKVVSYNYTREVKGDITESEKRTYTIDYFTNHEGKEVIRTNANVEYYKLNSNDGLEDKYTQKILENVAINRQGYIESISTTIDHLEDGATEPRTTTSKRTFTYDGDFCTSSTYLDENIKTTYKYNWSAYQLKRITVLKENFKKNTVDYNTYKYSFNRNQYYGYTGCEILPFVQSGLPQIYASMGYLGKCTPYILTEEVQDGYTKVDGSESIPNIEVINNYNFDGDTNNKLMYSGISNVYETYSITFSK